MTDGTPNSSINCPADYTWNGTVGAGTRAFDCALYYAEQAAAHNVALFAVGIGPGVYPDLLAAMATGTDPGTGDVYFEGDCGAFFPVANLTDLPTVMDQILARARSCAQAAAPAGSVLYLPVALKE